MNKQTVQKIIEAGTYDTPKYRYITEEYIYEIAIKRIEKKYLGTYAIKNDCNIDNPNGWKVVSLIPKK